MTEPQPPAKRTNYLPMILALLLIGGVIGWAYSSFKGAEDDAAAAPAREAALMAQSKAAIQQACDWEKQYAKTQPACHTVLP